jgi:SAM-dependent methyltransferase
MNKLSENIICPACSGNDFSALGYIVDDYEYSVPYTPTLLRCQYCSLIRHKSLPSYDILGSFYPDDYLVYNKSFKAASNALYSRLKNKLYSMKARKVAKYIGRIGNILDIGCANGAFLLSMKQYGNYGLYGLDIKNTGVDFKENSINFEEGNLEELEYPANFFDAIIMDNVLEHVPDPIVFMKKVLSILKPGGYIFGTTPNFSSVDRFVFQRYWGGFHMPRHIYVFSAKNLKLFMKNMGIPHIKFPLNANAADWAVSVQNFIRKEIKKQGKYKRASYFPIVAILLAPVSFFTSIFNLNGVMDFICINRK